MAALSRKSSKAAAALVMLLALLAAGAGPAAAQGYSNMASGCFVGWDPLKNILPNFVSCLLSRISNIFGPPQPAPLGQGLSPGYYNKSDSCPNAEQIIRKAVEDATSKTPTIGAGLIRLHFHDAFVRGCDASVLLNKTKTNNTDTERTAPPNANSLRGFEVIDAAKAALEAECPGKVSCADILAFAARDAASILSYGKIYYQVLGGRKDGCESFGSETNQLPGPDSTLQDLKNAFGRQGLNVTDMVTLSGAHSIGDARCFLFQDNLPNMNTSYAKYLTDTCNAGGPSFRVNQDNITANDLDTQYYRNILNKYELFKSDAALSSSETIAQVTANADDSRSTWYTDFGYAMVKMGNIIDTTPGKVVEIRKECWRINGP